MNNQCSIETPSFTRSSNPILLGDEEEINYQSVYNEYTNGIISSLVPMEETPCIRMEETPLIRFD
ncbi:hypothetical protein KM1_183770 [Entamoeba histolytica HM-3:IMSS]|uniref:Uncharacterized protein n=1 Tax=Entamoeba histolytica HM-3:IMSS TaxID=885315 RepID=M7W2Q9_ENTHI|nr:hypothetical protein KM1_183770 [Entamoeba histolytica HM-3:IMSS]